MSKNMKILRKNFCHDFLSHFLQPSVHKNRVVWQYIFGFHHKSRYHFQMVIFDLKILKKYRCVDASLSFQRIFVKVAVHRFFGSLNPNLVSDFRNWNWQIQYGGQNFEKCSELDEIVPFTNFWGRWIQVCHQIFKIQIGGSNMAAKILKNVQNSMKLSRSQIFGVAESKSAIKFSKFKVADPIWWSKFWKMFRTRWNCPVHRFLGSLNPNLPLNLKNSEWRIQYDGPRFEKQEKSSMKSYIIMFLGLLNPNLLSDFQYPRLRIQYGV